MPETLPTPWYSTPNTYLYTVNDFETLRHERGIHLLDRTRVNHNHISTRCSHCVTNLPGNNVLYRLQHGNH